MAVPTRGETGQGWQPIETAPKGEWILVARAQPHGLQLA